MNTLDTVLVAASGRSYTINFKSRRVISDAEEQIKLTPKQWALCALFVEHAGSIVSKDQLVTEVWRGTFVEDAAISVAVRTFRKVFANFDPNEFIATEHGIGYRLVADVSWQPDLVNGVPAEPAPHGEKTSEPQAGTAPSQIDVALNSADEVLRLSINGDDAKALEIGLERVGSLTTFMVESSRLHPDFVGAFVRLLRRVVRLACGRWNGANPNLAMMALLRVNRDVALRDETSEIGVLNILVDGMISLVGRRLPYTTEYQSYVIRDRSVFAAKLRTHFNFICAFIESRKITGTIEEESMYALVSTYISIRKANKILQMDSDIFSEDTALKNALNFRSERSRASFQRELRILQIRVAILPDKTGAANLRNIRNAKVILDGRLEKNSNDTEWIELWSKATLLLAYKVRDGEAPDQGVTWLHLLDAHEHKLLELALSSKLPSALSLVRILLRIDRKRRELNAPISPFIDKIIDLTTNTLPQLSNAPMHIFGPILNEIQYRPSDAHRQADLFSCLCDIYVIGALAFRTVRVGQAIGVIINRSSRHNYNFYKLILPALERIQGTKSLSNQAVTMAYEWHRCDEILCQENLPLTEVDKQRIRKVGIAAASESRHRIRDYVTFLFNHAIRTKADGHMARARSIADIASTLSEKYCVDRVELTLEIYKFLLSILQDGDELKNAAKNKILRIERNPLGISSVAGSMLFTATTLLTGQRHNYIEGRRLLFEAMVNADADEGALRVKTRRLFALHLSKSTSNYYNILSRYRSTPAPSAIPQVAIEAFAFSQDHDFRADYLALLREQKLPLLPVGSVVPGKLESVVRDGPLAGLVFSNENSDEPICVKKQFISRDLFASIASEIPEWNTNIGEVLGDDLVSVSGIPYGEKFLINIIQGDGHAVEATMVGSIFVAKLLNQILPKLVEGVKTNLFLGGGNSYAVLIVDKIDTWWLGIDDGRFHKQLTKLANLRRLLFVRKADNIIQQQINFVTASFANMTIIDVDERQISLRVPAEKGFNEIAIRTFISMFKKVFPTVELTMPLVDYERSKKIDSDEADAFW